MTFYLLLLLKQVDNVDDTVIQLFEDLQLICVFHLLFKNVIKKLPAI